MGLPRSGTESLQIALLRLGYDYTYHVRRHRLRKYASKVLLLTRLLSRAGTSSSKNRVTYSHGVA